MTTEMMQANEYDAVNTAIVPTDSPNFAEPITIDTDSETDLTAVWQSVKTNLTVFFANVTAFMTALFKDNRQWLIGLGWILLAMIGIRLVFAALDAIDDIPVVTPILKLIGLVYLIRFVWDHLIWEQNRQELMQTFNRLKGEVLGQ